MSGHKTTTQRAHNSWCYIYWPLHYSYGLRVSRSPLSVLNPFAHSLADSAKLLISVRTPSAQCIQSAFKSAISPELIFSRSEKRRSIILLAAPTHTLSVLHQPTAQFLFATTSSQWMKSNSYDTSTEFIQLEKILFLCSSSLTFI